MTETTALVETINNVGFPIFVCCVLFWFIKTILLKFNETLQSINISIVNNTKTIEKLIDKMGE